MKFAVWLIKFSPINRVRINLIPNLISRLWNSCPRTFQLSDFKRILELLVGYLHQSRPLAFMPSKEYGYRGGELLVTMASGDDNRLSRFVTNLYRGALQRDPNSSELQNGINTLGAAGANGGYSSLLSEATNLAV